jgi:ribosomal protein S13
MTPKIQTKEIMGNDMLSALQNAQGAGVNTSEIICVKLKMVAETVAGL